METLLKKYAKYFAFGVLVISVILMVYIVYQISLTKKHFANQLITKSITQTESDLNAFFERVDHLIYAVEQQYKTGFWSDLPREKIILHNISLIDNYAPISSIGIADRRGYELNVLPDTTSGQWLTRRVFADRWGYTERWRKWKLTDSLISLNQWEDSLVIDPRERPWFKGAIQADGKIFWTNPYKYTTGPEIGITASILLQNNKKIDSPSKIIAFDLTLNDLNKFIDDLELTNNQNIFLLTGDNSKVIALHNYSSGLKLSPLESSLLLSPEELENQTLLNVLKKEKNQTAFSFDALGKTWWGILRTYNISDDRKINIVSVLPEEDFALEITRTLWVGIGSFFLILILAFIVVWNHNKLHRISTILSEKNKLISEQKQFLFSEVHHRVKNNLALIRAFMELDVMNIKNLHAVNYFRKNMQRIKIIAVIQEEVYKSQSLGSVPIKNFIPGIIKYQKNPTADIDFTINADKIDININQALTFGLLLNELLTRILSQLEKSPHDDISIEIIQKNSRLTTHLHAIRATSTPEFYMDLLDEDIIKALSQQLYADIEISFDDGVAYVIEFKLKEQKGIVSSKHYRL